MDTASSGLEAALSPRSVAIIGASDNPHKVGGRPILYMKRYGYRGIIYPVNPARVEVQGLKAYPELEALPQVPELAIVAVAGEEAVRAVDACARAGVKVALVMASGFGETGEAGRAVAEFARQRARLGQLGARFEGVLVARMAGRGRELALGARVDPQFGPVVLVGDGGIYLEALQDFALLMPPFGEDEVRRALRRLRIAPLLAGVRGEAARDIDAVARMAVRLGEAILGWRNEIASVDVNPVMVFERGKGAVALDALVERA